MRFLPSDREQVQGVAARWRAQYCKNGEWGGSRDDPLVIYERLLALPKEATAADVAGIIGNDSWVGENCTECGKREAIVVVGEEPDYESLTVWLCAACIRRLAAMLDERTELPHE